MGWLARDGSGTVYSVGSAPSDGDMRVESGKGIEIHAVGQFDLRPARHPERRTIEWMGAYLRSAEMDDGSVWIPGRQALEESGLIQALPVSAEERRLAELYRSRGPAAVAEELRRFAAGGDPTGPR